MKKSKKVIVILLSIMIVLTSLVAYASSALRLGVLNPSFYANFMPALNAYDSMYDSFSDYLLEPIQAMEVPEEIQGVPEDLVKIAIPKKEFNKIIGKTIGGSVGWLLYNHDEVEIPVKYLSDNLYTTIANDERVINSETNIKLTMDAIVAQRLGIFTPSEQYQHTLRGYIYYFLTAGSQDRMDYFDYWTDVFFYYYGVRLTWITIGSFALLILLFAVLVLITKDKRETPIRIAKILCIFYGAINVLAALGLFFIPWIAKLFSSLSSYVKYLEYARSLTNSFGILVMFYALLLIIAATILTIVERKIVSKA